MEWGYAWGQGPFRILDALGVAAVAERARGEGRTIPPLVEALLESGRTSFYETKDGQTTVFGPTGVQPMPRAIGDGRAWPRSRPRVACGRRTPAPASWTSATAAASWSSTRR